MARDFDFNRRRSLRTAAPATPVVKPQPLPATTPKPKSPKSWWLMAVVVFVLVVIALILYTQSTISTKETANPVADSDKQSTIVSNEGGSPLTNQIVSIDVYNSGISADDYAKSVETLKKAGFAVKELEKSQFDYDKTYIWYRAEFLTEAEKVAATLKDRQVVLRQSQIAGAFDVLVYLGKQ